MSVVCSSSVHLWNFHLHHFIRSSSFGLLFSFSFPTAALASAAAAVGVAAAAVGVAVAAAGGGGRRCRCHQRCGGDFFFLVIAQEANGLQRFSHAPKKKDVKR
jgi:hypothetical protein